MERQESASHWTFEPEMGKYGANTIGFNGAEKLNTATWLPLFSNVDNLHALQ